MDEEVTGNGRSRYAADFPSNASATWLLEEKDERQVSWTLNRQRDTCGLVTPHRQGVKSKGWMIDRDLKWKRDAHLLSHHACSHWWLESGWV